MEVGRHALNVRAFVARRPDENHAAVYRWLLERNLKLYGVAFGLDALGDIYLTARIGVDAVTPAEVDRIPGAIAQTADDSFNVILGSASAESIKREWVWRRSGRVDSQPCSFRAPGPEAATPERLGLIRNLLRAVMRQWLEPRRDQPGVGRPGMGTTRRRVLSEVRLAATVATVSDLLTDQVDH